MAGFPSSQSVSRRGRRRLCFQRSNSLPATQWHQECCCKTKIAAGVCELLLLGSSVHSPPRVRRLSPASARENQRFVLPFVVRHRGVVRCGCPSPWREPICSCRTSHNEDPGERPPCSRETRVELVATGHSSGTEESDEAPSCSEGKTGGKRTWYAKPRLSGLGRSATLRRSEEPTGQQSRKGLSRARRSVSLEQPVSGDLQRNRKGTWGYRFLTMVFLCAARLVCASSYDYPPVIYTAQDEVPSAENKFFTDAEDTTHYWGAKNHRLVMSFIPLRRGYMGSRFRLRALISSGFKVRHIKLELPRTESSYWPSDSDIEGTDPLRRRRRLEGQIEEARADGHPAISPSAASSVQTVPLQPASSPGDRASASRHPLWSSFPESLAAPPKVVRHPPGTHHVKRSHLPLHPHPERRLGACEPLPPDTEDIVRQIFQKNGVSTDGILESKRAESVSVAKPFSAAFVADDEGVEVFDRDLELPPELLPPFSAECPPDTACGAEFCALFSCNGARKGNSPSTTRAEGKTLMWIPPKEIQLVVYVDVPSAPTSMQEEWRLQLLERPMETSQLKLYDGYEDVYQMEYNIGEAIKKKTNQVRCAFVIECRVEADLSVQFFTELVPSAIKFGFMLAPARDIRLEGGSGLGGANYTFTARVAPSRQRVTAEAQPQLHLTLPGPACSSSETDWVQPFEGKPLWLVSNAVRDCWDLFQACETVDSSGYFSYCELAYETLRENERPARKLVLSGITRDIPPSPFTLKFSGLYPPSTNLTNSVPLWYIQIASGYPKTLKEKEDQATLDDTYQKIIQDLYDVDECIGWTFRPFIDKRLRESKPKISHQSFFYTLPLGLLPTIVRGSPSDSYPFFLNLTFGVNTFSTGATVEFTFPHELFSGEGAAAADRYDPFLREFLVIPPPELVSTAAGSRTSVKIPDIRLRRQAPLSFYLTVPAMATFGQLSPVWSQPSGTEEYLAKHGWGLLVKDKKNKALLSTFSFPAPVYNRRMIGGVVGPEFQSWDKTNGLEMALIRLYFGANLPLSRIRIVISVMSNPLDAVDGTVMNRKDASTCTAILRGPDVPLIVQVSCPSRTEEIYQIDVSMQNGERRFPVGWYVAGVVPQQNPADIAWFKLRVSDSEKKTLYETTLLSDRLRRVVQQEPCINRLSVRRIKHPFTGYTSQLKFAFQLFNCYSPSQPLRPLPQQIEPLEARVPEEDDWPKKEYLSSVRVTRPNQGAQRTTQRAPLRQAMARSSAKRENRNCALTTCPAEDLGVLLTDLNQLDPPHSLDLLKQPNLLPSSPTLAAASVYYNFPTAEQAGVPRPPSIRRDAPAHRNPLSAHISTAAKEQLTRAESADSQIRIHVHVVVDEGTLSEEAINGFKRFVARKILNQKTGTLCQNSRGVFCYLYSWTADKRAVSWDTEAALSVPEFTDDSIPSDSGAWDVFDQLRTLISHATTVPCNGKAARMNWVILLTHYLSAMNYELEVTATHPATYALHERTAQPLHTVVIGWNPDPPEKDKSLQERLAALPFSETRRVFVGVMQDVRMRALAQDPVFISFLFPEATQYLAGHVGALQNLEELLFLIQEEYAASFVAVDICRHPLPPDGYKFGNSVNRRATSSADLVRPIELLYNGIVFDRLNWTISPAEVGVYTAAKLSWQFDMACEGELATQETS
ncbi:conserved hypothetical protein [Neospora caninum Liverpool]|uniref:Uncharacterized protein n=1 Tax=Neospora caninum (strain Liverpool) TaxID=572307 RepID=F0VB78_NEOCL|nr:conserved hypothetical protein [Neospora caninum Liverpool]CBZ51415.1 conserved hypothetical protein [Neospora caninum Liverpool]CEL68735.1 TPA: hypothetical protein BN1204_044760 [Neospora caninum Liverpool]|eukprot:XP_003881448.1 conserved hypothetical protein [Neospora caninum Liverpool]